MDLLHVVNLEDSYEQVYFSIQVYESNIWVKNFLITYCKKIYFYSI